jgi:fructosamine-3-kinase
MVGEVYAATLADGSQVVVKVDRRAEPQLAIEGMMLRYLAETSALPVPNVYHSEPALLIMQFLPGHSRFDDRAEAHAAELLAQLHDISADAYGFQADTLIGLLPQPNPWNTDWIDFFATQRLLHLGQIAVQMDRMPVAMLHRLEALCRRLDEFIDAPPASSLVHGDVWSSNLLVQDSRVTGVLDPAIYYGHPEVELAYIFLFHSFGQPFLQRYHSLRPIAPGFFEERIHVYQIYPLLSHVCHFGGHYVQDTAEKLSLLRF